MDLSRRSMHWNDLNYLYGRRRRSKLLSMKVRTETGRFPQGSINGLVNTNIEERVMSAQIWTASYTRVQTAHPHVDVPLLRFI